MPEEKDIDPRFAAYSQEEREFILMRYVLGASIQKIAQHLGVTEARVEEMIQLFDRELSEWLGY